MHSDKLPIIYSETRAEEAASWSGPRATAWLRQQGHLVTRQLPRNFIIDSVSLVVIPHLDGNSLIFLASPKSLSVGLRGEPFRTMMSFWSPQCRSSAFGRPSSSR